MLCHRCDGLILPGQHERCWWCTGVLCGPCWEETGHCGHAEAEALHARIATGHWPPRDELTAGHPAQEVGRG